MGLEFRVAATFAAVGALRAVFTHTAEREDALLMRLNPPTPPTTTRVEFFAFEKERAERADRDVPTTFLFHPSLCCFELLFPVI